MIRHAKPSDIQQICKIYNYYVMNTPITFEEIPVSIDEMKKRLSEFSGDLPWYVYEEDGEILGYVYASKWKGRCAYRFSIEITVYVDHESIGKGIGSHLYTEMLKFLKETSIHAVIAGISLPNNKSQNLHEKFGFKKVAHFNEVGFKFGKWIDVGYWELLL